MRATIAPVFLAFLAVALAGAALSVSVTAYTRAIMVRGGRYLVSMPDGRFEEYALEPITRDAFAARRSVRIDTHNITTTGKFVINTTATLVRSGPFRHLFLLQTSDAAASSNSTAPHTMELNLTANGAVLPGELPPGNARLLAHTGVSLYTSVQRDIVSRLDAATGGVTTAAPGPALSTGPYPSIGVFTPWYVASALRLEGTTWTWHTPAS